MMARPTTDDFLKLSVYGFSKMDRGMYTFGVLSWRRGDSSIGYSIGDNIMHLSWTSNGEAFTQDIPLVSVQVGYGLKCFFQCPQCYRRVAILYAGQRFYCRHCYGITYESCQKSHDTFLMRLGFRTDSQFRNWIKTAQYERALQKRMQDKTKRVGKAMLRRLERYRVKSGVLYTRQVTSILEGLL